MDSLSKFKEINGFFRKKETKYPKFNQKLMLNFDSFGHLIFSRLDGE